MTKLFVLPSEILELIIAESRPDGFGSLLLTCKRLYALSTPFIKRHKELCRQFGDFSYDCSIYRQRPVAASDLISLIAHEPIVAQYIKKAYLKYDSEHLIREMSFTGKPKRVPSIEDGGPVVELFASSPCLKQAGIDWREYYKTFETDVRERRYSQHGIAFLLTLLPKLQKLVLPLRWRSDAETDALLFAAVDRAKQSTRQHQQSGLASVTEISVCPPVRELNVASPLLALPRMGRFIGEGCIAIVQRPNSLQFSSMPFVAETLQIADLEYCHIDHVGIFSFLMYTPQLKTLKYTHSTDSGISNQDWDICAFMTAIARGAGSHLVELSVAMNGDHTSIVRGRPSMHAFQKLEKLELPMELILCTAKATRFMTYLSSSVQSLWSGSQGTLLPDLVPATVSHLSLRPLPGPNDERVLKLLFPDFRAVRKSHLPALQNLYLGVRQNDSMAYKDRYNKIVREGRKEGVEVSPC